MGEIIPPRIHYPQRAATGEDPFCGERFASSEAAWKPGLNIPNLEKVFGVLYLIREIAAH